LQLRADNLALHAKATQRLDAWEAEREELQAEIARLRAQLTQQEKRVGSVPSWERDHNSRVATELEAEQRELASAMEAAERVRRARGELPPASPARGAEPSSRGSASDFLASFGGAPAGVAASSDVGVCISPDSRGRQRLALSLAGEGPVRPLNVTTDAPPRRARVRLNFLGDDCVASIGLEARAPAAPDAPARPSAAAAADAASFLAGSSAVRPADAASLLAGSSARPSLAAAFLDNAPARPSSAAAFLAASSSARPSSTSVSPVGRPNDAASFLAASSSARPISTSAAAGRPNDAASFLAASSAARPSSTSAALSPAGRPNDAESFLAASSAARPSLASGSSPARLESRLGVNSRPTATVAPSRFSPASSPPAATRSAIDLLAASASAPASRIEPGVERSSGVAPSRFSPASSPPAANRSAIDLLVASAPVSSSGVAPTSGCSSTAAYLSATSARQPPPPTPTSTLRPAVAPQPSSASGFLNAISAESGMGRPSDFAKPISARSALGVGAR